MYSSDSYIYIYMHMCAQLLSRVPLFATPWVVDHKTPLSMEFSRQEYWVAISHSRGSSWSRDWTHVSYISCIGSQILYLWATWEAYLYIYLYLSIYIYSNKYSFLDSFPLYVITRYWIQFPVLYRKSLLLVDFIYSRVYILTPNS